MAIYTCVLLDVDNTLLDFDAAERQALTDMLTEYELPHDARACEIYHAVNRELWDALAKGQLTKPKLFQQRFGRFMKAMDLPDNGKAVQMNDRYEELLSTHADLLPGALTALEELSEVATLAIVSNGAVMVQEARIRDSGIERYMDGVYISEKVGAAKPSAKLFEQGFLFGDKLLRVQVAAQYIQANEAVPDVNNKYILPGNADHIGHYV